MVQRKCFFILRIYQTLPLTHYPMRLYQYVVVFYHRTTSLNTAQFLLRVEIPTPYSRSHRSEATASYICPDVTSTICQLATIFTLDGDRLYADKRLVSTKEGVEHHKFSSSVTHGDAIDRGFSLVDGLLLWHHPSFTGGWASFCLSTSNFVLSVFEPAKTPSGCIPVNLTYSPCKSRVSNLNDGA
jgi:hypothetical protein